MAEKKKNRIVDMDPGNLREIDGVVFDLDSFARHCAPHPNPSAPMPAAPSPSVPETTAPASAETSPETSTGTPNGAPAPVFAVDPVHAGWYETATPGPAYPVMAGAVAVPGANAQLCCTALTVSGSGSYASSYLSSFMTSFSTSFQISWMRSWIYGSGSYLTSGSWLLTSGGSAGMVAGGYGLELI